MRIIILLVLLAAVITQTNFITLLTLAIAAIAPYLLKFLPASWKGSGMALFALLVSAALGVLDLWLTGGFDNFNPQGAAIILAAYIGVTQAIYALFKDPLNLADPPRVVGS
jgi:hypothetical protein